MMRVLLVTLVLVARPLVIQAADNVTETFTSGESGWTGDGSWTVQGTNHYLRGTFASQSVPFPQSASWRADVKASSGAFAGNYQAAGANLIGFSFYAEKILPSELQIRIMSSNAVFFRSLTSLLVSTGHWHHFAISLAGAVDGRWVGGDEALFRQAMACVTNISVQVMRSGTVSQGYRMDNVFLDDLPVAHGVIASGTGHALMWTGLRSGRDYQLQISTNLHQWVDLDTIIAPSSGEIVYTLPMTGCPVLFHRLATPPITF